MPTNYFVLKRKLYNKIMTETIQDVVSFMIKIPEGTYDPVREALARELRIWRDFGLTPSDFKLFRRKTPAGLLMQFPRKLPIPIAPRSA